MNKPLDLTKPVQTRDGRKVRILCTDKIDRNRQCVVGAVLSESKTDEWVTRWSRDGSFTLEGKEDPTDLINVPEKRAVWVNIYDGQFYSNYCSESKEAADSKADIGNRIACVRVEFTEGEGL